MTQRKVIVCSLYIRVFPCQGTCKILPCHGQDSVFLSNVILTSNKQHDYGLGLLLLLLLLRIQRLQCSSHPSRQPSSRVFLIFSWRQTEDELLVGTFKSGIGRRLSCMFACSANFTWLDWMDKLRLKQLASNFCGSMPPAPIYKLSRKRSTFLRFTSHLWLPLAKLSQFQV